jgi:diguanylate cyclase (GGDEF)-like protein
VIQDAGHVLIADDEPNTLKWAEMNLNMAGFHVSTALEGQSALQHIIELRPDLVILDVGMPYLDGLQVCREVRSDPRTRYTSVIFLTGRDERNDRIAGLEAGADDYLVKPIDADELIARIRRLIRRAQQMRAVNPLTQLPGNVDIGDELKLRVESEANFGLLYIDLDNFKSFNDYYGFARGDVAIKRLAEGIRESVDRLAGREGFIGHIGGDDFAAIVPAQVAESVAQDIIEKWDSRVTELYEAKEVQLGFVEILDRRGEVRRFPLTTVSIGIATDEKRAITTHWQAAEIAREMKQKAKKEDVSSYSIDRRETPAEIRLP